jgi:hypothetical protein
LHASVVSHIEPTVYTPSTALVEPQGIQPFAIVVTFHRAVLTFEAMGQDLTLLRDAGENVIMQIALAIIYCLGVAAMLEAHRKLRRRRRARRRQTV